MKFDEIKELLMLIDNTKLEYVKLNTLDIELEVYKKVVEKVEHHLEKEDFNNKTNDKNFSNKIIDKALNNENNKINDEINNIAENKLDYENNKSINENDINYINELNTENNCIKNLKEVKSPLIGTFYESPDPNSEPFVKIGSHVEKGDTLCIVEAMKLMNEIKSEFSGKVIEIKALNEKMVEYGETLFIIEED